MSTEKLHTAASIEANPLL